jgi:hypothetical protein
MQPRYVRMLGFWVLTLSRPQSAAVTPSGSSNSYLGARPRLASLASRIESVAVLLLPGSGAESVHLPAPTFQRYPTERWQEWFRKVLAAGGAVTLDLCPNWGPKAGPVGSLAPAQLDQVRVVLFITA